MPNTRRSKRSSGRKAAGAPAKIARDVDEIMLLQMQQLRYGRPNVADVIFPNIKPKSYTFAVSYPLTQLTASSTVVTVASYVFTLGALPNYAAFGNLFDRYRILMVNAQFLPNNVNVTLNGTVTTAIDYDDASSPSAELPQRDTALTVPIGTYFERTLRPRLAAAAYSGSFTSYANLPSTTWLDAASSNIQYYGIKAYVPVASANGGIYNITAKLIIQFKNNF
jgi:hypothetical protein